MINGMKILVVASASLLVSAPFAFAQTADGTTLSGAGNVQVAQMTDTSKGGMMKKSGTMKKNGMMKKSGSMTKSDGMKSGGMQKDGAMSGNKMDGGMAK